MKAKKLFLFILLIIIFLCFGCIFFEYKKLKIRSNIDTGYKNVPIKRTLKEAQKEINLLLLTHPIKFINNGYLLEDNKTVNKIVFILNNTIGDMIIKVVSHSDTNGSNSYNRKLTQKRADNIASYIKQRYNPKLINAIGYGEEFPLPKDSNRSNNRIEIYLKRIYP